MAKLVLKYWSMGRQRRQQQLKSMSNVQLKIWKVIIFRHHGAVNVSLNSREIFSFVPMKTAVSFSQEGWIYFLLFVKNDKIKLFEESKKRMSSETIKRRKFKQNFMRNGKGWSCRICPENNNSKWKINSFRFPIFLE